MLGSSGRQLPSWTYVAPSQKGLIMNNRRCSYDSGNSKGFWSTVPGTWNKADIFFIISHSLCHAASCNTRLKEGLKRSNWPSLCLQVSLYFNHWRQLMIIFRKKKTTTKSRGSEESPLSPGVCACPDSGGDMAIGTLSMGTGHLSPPALPVCFYWTSHISPTARKRTDHQRVNSLGPSKRGRKAGPRFHHLRMHCCFVCDLDCFCDTFYP